MRRGSRRLFAASFVLGMLLVVVAAEQARLARLLESTRRAAVSERDSYQERERLFSTALESSHDAIITTLPEGTITGWNVAAQSLFGWKAEEAVAVAASTSSFPRRCRGDQREDLEQARKGVAIRNFETVRSARDGREIEVLLSVSPVKSRGGEIVGSTQIARDIGGTKATETALRREAEERMRIFETSQDLILVTDTRGNFIQVSPSAYAILGYRPEEMIGHSAVNFIYPGDLESTREEMRAARHGRVMRNFMTSYVHKDGRVVALAWMGTWSEPVRRCPFLLQARRSRDQSAQDALRESERMARRIIETALDAFVQTDDAGLVTDWNSQAEKIFGWPRSEAVGHELGELIVPERLRDRYPGGSANSGGPGRAPSSGISKRWALVNATARKSRSS